MHPNLFAANDLSSTNNGTTIAKLDQSSSARSHNMVFGLRC